MYIPPEDLNVFTCQIFALESIVIKTQKSV